MVGSTTIRTCRFTMPSPSGHPDGTGQRRRGMHVPAWATTLVRGHFVSKDGQRTANEPGDSVRVPACPSSIDEVAKLKEGRDAATDDRGLEGERFGHLCQPSQSIDTGPTLARALLFHVPH